MKKAQPDDVDDVNYAIALALAILALGLAARLVWGMFQS